MAAAAPYAFINTHEMFHLLNGEAVGFKDVVTARYFPGRYVEEVKLLQRALGVEPDGIIGPKTRAAALEAWRRRTGSE